MDLIVLSVMIAHLWLRITLPIADLFDARADCVVVGLSTCEF
jgi:hypothetical protein